MFTRFFLKGIGRRADHNGDGLVTTDELASFVKPQVSIFVGEKRTGVWMPIFGSRG